LLQRPRVAEINPDSNVLCKNVAGDSRPANSIPLVQSRGDGKKCNKNVLLRDL